MGNVEHELSADLAQRFLEAKSVAIVGASERQHHTRALLACLEAGGIAMDKISLVSPSNSMVHGIETVGSLSQLDTCPDLVFSLVPARYVAEVLRDTASIGAKAFVSIADGFADAGDEGRALQEELISIARANDIAMLGPNTLGYLAPGFGVGAWVGDWSAIDVPRLKPGAIAIVAQSSGMLNLILQLAAHRRIGIRGAVSVGNEAVVDAAQFIQAFAEDDDTQVIGIVLESTTRPRALANALLTARRHGKRVFVFKFGNSEIGRRNALSHSGRLASEGRVWDALFDKLGVALAADFDEFVDGLGLIAQFEGSDYAGVGDLGFLTVSGGDVGLLSDLCEQIGVPLAPLTDETREALIAVEGNTTHAASNPIDLGLIGHRVSVLDGIAAVVIADPGVGFVACRLALPWRFSDRSTDVYETIRLRARELRMPFIVMTRAAEPLDPAWLDFFAERGVSLVNGYGSGLRTLRAILTLYQRADHAGEWVPTAIPARVAQRGPETLLEWQETQDLIAGWGISHVEAGIAASAGEAAQVASRIGYPVCVKGLVSGVLHKSDAGLVRIGINGPQELAAACLDISAQSASRSSTSPVQFEIQQMVSISQEFLLGMVRDPIMGPVITIGSGGTEVESIRDIACVLPPVTDDEVISLLSRLRIGAQIFDNPSVSKEQQQEFLSLVRDFAKGVVDAGEVVGQVDINPVVFTKTGQIVAVDAVVMSDIVKGEGK